MFGSRRWNFYVLRELMTPTLLGLLLYTFVLLMNHFFLVAEKALAKNLSPELTLQLFMAGIPKLLVLSIPMSVLLGTLIGLGRLSADREWVALQAAGHGPAALFRPVFLHGLIGTLVTFVIYVVVVPQTHYMVRNLRGQVLFSSNLAADLTPRVLYDLPDDAVIHVEDIRAGGERRLENVLLIQPDPDKEGLTQLVVARFGDLHPAADGSGALLVDLYHGEAHYYRSDQPEKYQVATFDSVVGKRLEPPPFLRGFLKAPNKVAQDFSLTQLLAEIRKARAERDDLEKLGGQHPERLRMAARRVARTRVELHRRLAVPVACLCFALLALPLGLTTARSGKGAGFATSVLVIIVYRLVFVATTNQAMVGRIPAPLGPWAPDLLIFLWAAVALWRMRARPSARRGNLFTLPLTLWRRVGKPPKQPVTSEWEPTDEPAPGVEEPTLPALTGTTRRFVARLDRYVAVAFLRIFGFSLVSVYLIYAVVEGQELIDKTLRTHQPMSLVADYLLYFPPGVLYVVLPIASLIGAVVSITLLARSSELVAVRAAGISMRRVTAPIVLTAMILGGLLYLVQDRIAPASNRKAQAIKDQIQGRAPRTHGLSAAGSWRFGAEGDSLYHYVLHDAGKDEYQGLSVFTLDRSVPRIVEHRFSELARFVDGAWQLDGGWHRSFYPPDGEAQRTSAADIESSLTRHDEPYDMALDIPSNLVEEKRLIGHRRDDLPDQMSQQELKRQIRTLSNSGYDITTLRVAYHRKFAQSLAPLVMVLLGLPFAFKVGRRGSLYGIGVALLLVLVYWATFAVFNALGLETILPAPVAAWAPNVLYSLLGVYLLLYVRT